MTKEEYKKCVKLLDSEYEVKKNSIMREYAFSNSNISVGDVITDHIGTIRVKNIKWREETSYSLPSCVYYGQPLKKDGTETIKKENRAVYQENLKAGAN